MSSHKIRLLTAMATAGAIAAGIVYTPATQAFNFGDMMNPGKWMGGGRDYDDDWYDYGPGGPYGPQSGVGPYGGGPYGAPGYGPYGGPGFGGPGFGGPGFGAPGYYGAPGHRTPAAAPSASAPATSPSSSSSSENVKSAEIEALRKRIEELEAGQQPSNTAPPPPADWGSSSSTTSPPSSSWGSAPAFRPLNKY